MDDKNDMLWLEWARKIQAISQTGSHYAQNDFDYQRYKALQGIAAEIISKYSKCKFSRVYGMFEDQTGYATPRVDVRGAVFREGKILLVRERMDGGWTMPGGWADVGDIPSEAIEREVLEETGFIVQSRKVIGVYDANRIEPLELFQAYKIVFLCDLLGGQARTSNETSDVKFFSLDQIPDTLSGERTSTRHLKDAFQHILEPDKMTVFD
jgi:ADP-ribose pyrophosphatase YjhB (NUDIX family)